MKTTAFVVFLFCILFSSRGLTAEESNVPRYYATFYVSTTPFYLNNQGQAAGWQKDYTPGIGFGYELNNDWAIGLNISPNFVKDHYDSMAVLPGAYYTMNSFLFAAFQFYIPVDPRLDFGLEPGIAAYTTLQNGLIPYLEIDTLSIFAREKPDLSLLFVAGLEFEFR